MKSKRTFFASARADEGPLSASETMARLRRSLKTRPRDLLLFDLAVHTGAKMTALLQLKVKDLAGLQVGDKLPLGQGFPGTPESLVMNESVWGALNVYLNRDALEPQDYLFKSRKGSRPLNLSSVSHMVRRWFEGAGLEASSGARSLRRMGEAVHRGDPGLGEEERAGALKPIETATLQETVYKELLRAIVSGRMPPGEKLVIERLARRMQVSPMPVREALRRLEAGGFVTSQTRRSCVVNELSRENLEEILKIRLVLESMAAELAARQRSEKALKRLSVIHQQFVRLGRDAETANALNREFHHTIYRQARMPILQQVIEGLWDRISPYLIILIRETEEFNLEAFKHYHQKMLEGMRRKDPQTVRQWLEADLTEAARVVSLRFASRK